MAGRARSRAAMFLESVRHTPPRQLVARAELMLRRRWLERFPAWGDARSVVDAAAIPDVAPVLPLPIFPPRAALAGRDGGRLVARLLGRTYPLDTPIAWNDRKDATETHLQRLTLHYLEFLEGVEPDAATSIALDWIDRNPPYRRGYWLESWNSYALSIRAVVWMQRWAAGGFRRAPGSDARLLGSLVRQLAFLERNLERDIRGNHILKNVKALLWAGAFFTGAQAERWRRLGASLLEVESHEQLLDDGMHFERSPAYHAQVTADLLECAAALPPGALRERLEASLAKAAQALADLTHPDGAPSLFNDGGLHMAYPPGAILDAATRLLGVRAAPRPLFALREAGYFGARAGGDYVLVDCGAIGPDALPGHAHGDVLAFEWTVGGRRVVVDTGVFEYEPGAKREACRATAAHNTLTLDDRDQAEFYSSFRVGRRPKVVLHGFEERPGGFLLEGSHDGFARLPGAPRHVRRFAVSPRTIEVEDRVEGGRGQRARARLLIAPGFTVAAGSGGATIEGGGLKIALTTTAALSVVDAPWWPDFGVELPAKQVVLDYGEAPCQGGFILGQRRE